MKMFIRIIKVFIIIAITVNIASLNVVYADPTGTQGTDFQQDIASKSVVSARIKTIINNVKTVEETYTAQQDCDTDMTYIESLKKFEFNKKEDGTIEVKGDPDTQISLGGVASNETKVKAKRLVEIYNSIKKKKDSLTNAGVDNSKITVDEAVKKLENNESLSGIDPEVLKQAQERIMSDDYQPPEGVSADEMKRRAGFAETRDMGKEFADERLEASKGKQVIYTLPERNPNGGEMGEIGLDQAITDGEKFLEGNEKKYDENKLKEFSGSLYNVVLTLGVIAAIAMGGTIGINIMLGSLEAKAEAKKLLVPYVVGCVIIFGGFGIWKLIIEIFQQL